MGVTEQQVMDALRAVTDPDMGASIVDLDMVRAVETRRGRVAVALALTSGDASLRDEMTSRVNAALRPVPGVRDVTVELTMMTPAEVDAVRAKVRAAGQARGRDASADGGRRGPGAAPARSAPLGHEEGRANPFMDSASTTRVVGISSGKGGVGKSSVTVNLAVSLVKAGYDVGILDADVYGFSVPAMLGIDADPVVRDGRILPPVAFGVRCMSMGFFVDDDQPVMWRGPMLHKALEQFLVDVDWGAPDFLLVDMPPGTGDVALSMAQYLPASEIYVVTTPQPAAKRVAQRSAYMAKKINLPLRGVIENMSWFTGTDGARHELFGSGGGAALAEELGVPLLGQVPLVPALREGGDTGCPVTISDARGEASVAFAAVAERLAARGRARIFRSELTVR